MAICHNRRKKISMNNAVLVRLMVFVFMERMEMQCGKKKCNPQQAYQCT
jgi:hypothetical protein